MKGNDNTKFMLALAIGLLIVVSVVRTTITSSNRSALTETDSNNQTILTGAVVTFADSKYNTCSDVAVYNITNGVESTSNYTISNCQATLSGTLFNNTNQQFNYTGVDNDGTVTSNVSETLLNVMMYLLIAVGIFYMTSKLEK